MATTIKKQLIFTQLSTQLARILKSNGFYSDLGKKVTEAKVNPFGANRVDGIDFIEANEDIKQMSEAMEWEDSWLTVEIKFVSVNAVSMATARTYEADIRSALQYDDSLAGLLLEMEHVNTKFVKEQDGDVVIGGKLTVRFEFTAAKLSES